MTRRKLTDTDLKIKAYLLRGKSGNQIASMIGIARQTVYDHIAHLEACGAIRRVPGTKSPICYEEPFAPFCTPVGGEGENPYTNVGDVRSERTPPSPLPPKMSGVWTGKTCPPGYREAHLNGDVRLVVRKVGNFDDIKAAGGKTYVGSWTREYRIKGATVHDGELRIFGQAPTIRFVQGDRGKLSFSFRPKRIYLDPLKFPDEQSVMDLFIDRAKYVADLLRQTGWQLTDPKTVADLHIAWQDDALAAHMGANRYHPEGADLVVDTSPGSAEVEMEGILGDPNGWAKARLMSELPTRILRTESVQASLVDAAKAQVAASEDLSERIRRLEALTVQLIELIDKQARLFEAQARVNVAQAEINIANGASDRDAPTGLTPATNDRMEGYQ